MQQVLPTNLNYNDIKPVGYPSKIKQMKFTPTAFNTSNQGVSSSDVIRFNISDNGFWDPYSAYIKLEVNVSGMDGTKSSSPALSTGSLQIDNSALGYISQFVIYDKGTEIERIEEYDTIGAILNDMNSTDYNRLCRQFEGLSYQNVTGGHQYQNPKPTYGSQGGNFGWSPDCNYLPSQYTHANNVVNLSHGSTGMPNRYEYVLTSDDGKHTLQKPTSNFNSFGIPITSTFPANGQGYQIPFNTSLSSGSNEPILTKNFVSYITYKGALGQSVFTDVQTFCIPILSGLLGILMPKESYKYIPMKALQELILEFRLNPYAMFTSGYNDGTGSYGASTSLGTTTTPMLSRIFRITKFEINVEMQYFEPAVENVILNQLNSTNGIMIHSQSWQLGPRYSIAANSGPTGTYQINLGFESMKNVIWCFIPDDFQNYSFCRKQYRISANITQYYIKIGSQYYPPLPITGHAGTPSGYNSSINDVDANNAEFVIQLYKTFGKFQDCSTSCIVNQFNFAVNERAYDPTDKTVNNHNTAYSLPLFHENRCIGKAIYAMNLETLNQDYSVISGLNTINNRPFELTIKSDNTNAFPRPYQMYVFCNYDMLIQLKTSGVQVLGRG